MLTNERYLNEGEPVTTETIQSIYDIDSPMLQLHEAPFNSPLLVIATTVIRREYSEDVTLEAGDVFVKLTQDEAGKLNKFWISSGHKHKEDDFCYVIIKSNNVQEFRVKDAQVSKSEGLVVEAKYVFAMEDELINDNFNYIDFALKARRNFIIEDIRSNLTNGEFKVVVFGERNEFFTRGWIAEADIFNAVKATVSSGDIPYTMHTIREVQVIKK